MPDSQIIRVTPLEWCIAMHESVGGRLFAVRHEPDFLARYVAGRGFGPKEEYFRATSFGLWQIMGENLRRIGLSFPASEWRRWAADPAAQLAAFRKLWALNCDQGDPQWRDIEAWNKGDAGEDRLDGPTAYFQKVDAWRKRLPAAGPDGMVELVCRG